MYTLRIIEETREDEKSPFEQVIENFELGGSYSIIKKGSSREFDEQLKDWPSEDKSQIESIVCGQSGVQFFIFIPTMKRNNTYFIMTDSGKTFERL